MKSNSIQVKTILTTAILLNLSFMAGADVLCVSQTGKSRVASVCNAKETTFIGNGPAGPQGPQGEPGYSAINTTPCSQAVVGDWSGYLAGSAFADIEHCTVSVAPDLSLSGDCWQYTNGGRDIKISSGYITVKNVTGYQTCYVTGKFTFANGISATLDANTSPDKNSIVGVHWNSAGGLGTFNAVRLIK